MNEPKKKHWSELGRVKNAAWFRQLPELDQKAVLAALEYDTHESAVGVRGALAVFYSTAICTAAFSAWAVAFSMKMLWFAVAGGFAGGIVGFLCRNIIVAQKTPQDAEAMQRNIGIFIGLPEAAFLAAGLVALIVRSIA